MTTDLFRPPPEPPLETAEAAEGAQPFTRCASCHQDGSVYATACERCGAPLDTPAQRAFNERLWAERRAQEIADRRDEEARREARARDHVDVARLRREVAEALAGRERERVDDALPDGPLRGAWIGHRDTAGMRLLRRLPGTGWRIAAACVAIGGPLIVLLRGRGLVQFLGGALLWGVLLLFVPRRARRPGPR